VLGEGRMERNPRLLGVVGSRDGSKGLLLGSSGS
jgi:hypothetical protein